MSSSDNFSRDRDGDRSERQDRHQDGHRDERGQRRGQLDRRDQHDRRDQRDRHDHPDRQERRARVSTNPRTAAFDVLLAVEESDSYANLLLPQMLRERKIMGREAAFATELAYGALRMQGLYDPIIEKATARPIDELDPPIRAALRLGSHQLLGMRTPAHAAVSETVAVARDRISAGPAQLVNAALRRVSEKDLPTWLAEIDAEGDDDRAVAIRHSHPEWIIRSFRQALAAPATGAGDPTAELAQLLEANNRAPRVHLVLRPGLSDDDDLDGVEVEHGRFAPTARVLTGGDPGRVEAIVTGRAGVQDEGSQLVALATAAAPIDGTDDTWLDMCAGPGGKAALFASLLAEAGGGTFIANEMHPHRTRLVSQNLRAVPHSVEILTRTGDGRDFTELEPSHFDRVLVDAPCTGLGALRRRPEARWRRGPQDLPLLTELQRELLESALACVRVGGVVGYVTCSPHVAETTLVVKDAIRHAAKAGIEVEILDAAKVTESVTTESGRVDLNLAGPYVQLWPHRHGTDAMFLALLRRTA